MSTTPRCIIIRDPGGDDIVRVSATTYCTDGSILIVPAGSVAFFVLNGNISDPYKPGRYEIQTGVDPFFIRYRNLMTGGDPGITVNVFYVAVEKEKHMTFGSGDVLFTEKRFHQTVRAQALLDVDFRVKEPKAFLSKIVGMHENLFGMEDVEPKLRALMCGPVVEEMGQRLNNMELGTINTNLSAISFALLPSVSASFSGCGIDLIRMQIGNIHIKDSDLSHLQDLERAEAEGKMGTDLEKYNLTQIYNGDVSLRTRAEVLTGMPRGYYSSGANHTVGASLASLAANVLFLRSLPEETWNSFLGALGEVRENTSSNDLDIPPENDPLPPIRRDE